MANHGLYAYFMRWLCMALLSAGSLLNIGCGRADPVKTLVLQSAEVRAAKESSNDELRRLVAQVEQEQGLPKQLDKPLVSMSGNAASALEDCFSPSVHSRQDDLAEAELTRFLSEGPNEQLGDYIGGLGSLPVRIAEAVDKPRCHFLVKHEYGFFANQEYLDDVALASRILLIRAADAGMGGDAGPVVADLVRSLRLSQWLSQVDRIEARVLATSLRAEALGVAEWMYDTGLFRKLETETLYMTLRDTLSQWPPDRKILVGERAAVIHTYEAIRLGLLSRIMTGRERTDLSRRGELESLESASDDAIDRDEALYLRSIALLISMSENPYFERLGLIERIAQPSEERLFAERIFLPDLVDAQRAVARDRARCEAWSIALAAVAGMKPTPFKVCPTNGIEYEVVKNDDEVLVKTGDAVLGDVFVPGL